MNGQPLGDENDRSREIRVEMARERPGPRPEPRERSTGDLPHTQHPCPNDCNTTLNSPTQHIPHAGRSPLLFSTGLAPNIPHCVTLNHANSPPLHVPHTRRCYSYSIGRSLSLPFNRPHTQHPTRRDPYTVCSPTLHIPHASRSRQRTSYVTSHAV